MFAQHLQPLIGVNFLLSRHKTLRQGRMNAIAQNALASAGPFHWSCPRCNSLSLRLFSHFSYSTDMEGRMTHPREALRAKTTTVSSLKEVIDRRSWLPFQKSRKQSQHRKSSSLSSHFHSLFPRKSSSQ